MVFILMYKYIYICMCVINIYFFYHHYTSYFCVEFAKALPPRMIDLHFIEDR